MISLIDKPIRIIAALVLLVTALSGCITTVVEPETVRAQAGTQVEYAYIKPGADFSRYTKLMSDGLEIYYPEQSAAPSTEELVRIREAFRSAFLGALDDDYPIVTTPGFDVMRVKAQVVDINMGVVESTGESGGVLEQTLGQSELTFVMEMFDSKSGTMLARASDRSTNMAVANRSSGEDVLDAAARHWAGLFRDWLDRSLGPDAK